MFKMDKVKAIILVGMMVATTFTVLATSVAAAQPRAGGENVPTWDPNTEWITRNDMTDFTAYGLFTVSYTDSQTPGGPYTVKTDMEMTPTSGASQRKSVVASVDTNAKLYHMTVNGQSWENGSWATVITNAGGDPNAQIGATVNKGSYKFTATTTGTSIYSMINLDFVSGTMTATEKYDATGSTTNDPDWTFDITDSVTDATSNGIDAQMKPNWKTSPMNVGDSWQQTDKLSEQISENYAWGGGFSGSGTASITQDITYHYTWTVASKAQKTISNTWKGSTTFPEGYQITRNSGGTYDWDYNDGTNSNSGTDTVGPYEFWYASHGDNFDAGWIIDYNGSTRLIWSTYIAFQDSAPAFTSSPEGTTVIINSDEAWDYAQPNDYAVTDPDSPSLQNGAGTLVYTIEKSLPGHTGVVLKNLTIASDTGEITFTPTQKDVADGYLLTIHVSDSYDKGAMSTEANFTLNIKNKNHAPVVVQPLVMADFTMKEGETNTPTWTLAQAFHDSDMDANPLMGNAPYDAADKMTYSVSNNGSVRLVCSNGNDLTASNQCADVRFNAIDGKFPRDVPVVMTITATDKYGLKVSDQVQVQVQHVNHAPVAIKAKTSYKMDEDSTGTIDMKTLFKDMDVYDPNYVTVDQLVFDKDGESHLTITITGTKATIKPDKDWNGQEDITFSATDKSNAKAEVQDTITVNPVNDAPTVTSVSPTSDPTISETNNGLETGTAGIQKFSVVATDVDNTVGVIQNQVLIYNWTVEDESSNVYTVDNNKADWTFTAAFDCDFANGGFCGGDSTKTYYVTATVSDGVAPSVEAKKWYITVKNVNRAPVLDGMDVFTVNSAGVQTPIPATTPLNYSVSYGKVIELDVTKYVTDLDVGVKDDTGLDNLDKLSFEWTSTISGSFGSAADVKVGAGSIKAPATMSLKPGTHIITVRVTDSDQASDTYTITIKVGSKPKSGIPGFEGVFVVSAMVIAVVAVARKYRK